MTNAAGASGAVMRVYEYVINIELTGPVTGMRRKMHGYCSGLTVFSAASVLDWPCGSC